MYITCITNVYSLSDVFLTEVGLGNVGHVDVQSADWCVLSQTCWWSLHELLSINKYNGLKLSTRKK